MDQLIYLVRHCQAAGQEADAPLTEAGERQAVELAERFAGVSVERIISSPFVRARRSIEPLAERLGLTVELDERLVERVLSPIPLENWRERLAETFDDLDLSVGGGETSRTAMTRGLAVVDEARQQPANPTILATHGNLMILILKHFNSQIGFADWENLRNPDVYCVRLHGNKPAAVTREPG